MTAEQMFWHGRLFPRGARPMTKCDGKSSILAFISHMHLTTKDILYDTHLILGCVCFRTLLSCRMQYQIVLVCRK
jgi:hypothetical protein